jgi:LysM repeat protein
MPQRTRRSPARLLAPLAILAAAGALAYVITSSEPTEDASRTDASEQQANDLGTTATGTETAERRGRRAQDQLPEGCYVVKAGDTLGGIAEKTGVPVERLQEANPDIDPQQLVSGQRLNLRDGGCD